MTILIILLFIIGYLSITLEHPLKLDKTVPSLLMAAIMWALLSIGFTNGWFSIIDSHGHVFNMANGSAEANHESFIENLMHHFGKTSEILIFLIGAMTIVEIIDLHRGFDVIKSRINTSNKVRLLWVLGTVAFILSSIIDNLTATIVLITLLRKLVPQREYRIWYASLIIIAANAGGAWSPIGDVTTTMLWIANKVTAAGLSEYVIVPAVLCFVVPFFIASKLKPFQGTIVRKTFNINEQSEKLLSSKKMLFVGLGAIVFVPIFKIITGLPPYIGMMFSLGFVWLFFIIIKQITKLAEDNTFKLEEAIHKTGSVYLSIPAHKTGTGKISISVKGSQKELSAISLGDRIETGSAIKVIGVEGSNLLIVEKI